MSNLKSVVSLRRALSCGQHLTNFVLILVAILLSGVVPASAQTSAATTEESVFFYSGGKKHELEASTQWAVVQLDDNADESAVEAVAKGRSGIARNRAAVRGKRKNILALPLETGASATTRRQLRSGLKNVRGVRRVLRTFGKGQLPIIETDEFLIRFQDGISKGQAQAIVERYGAKLVKSLGRYAPNGFVARIANPDTTTATDAANALYELKEVVWSHPDLIWPKQRRFTPNDPLYSSQWHLNNTGQGGGLAGADVKAAAAWDISRGSSSIIVAIIDDGVDVDHPDLAGKVVAGYDFIDGDNNPRPVDSLDNHGTACAGVAAANGNNNLGVSGMAPNVKVMPIRLIGGFISLQDEADAFTFAANNGAHVISNSWGPEDGTGATFPLPDSTRNAINYAVTSGRGGKGCVVLWAAGNGNESADLDGYSANPQVISVAASTNRDVRSFYSDFGTSVDICAPSNGGTLSIVTIDRTGAAGYSPNNGYSQDDYTDDFGGTSSATPLVAGVAALVLSVNPNLTAAQVQTLLQSNADKIDTAGGAYSTTGHSTKYGYGRVNAQRVLQAASPSTTTYTLSGRVATSAGTGVSGVTITVSTIAPTATTDANGNYSITGVPAGTPTVTPTWTGYTFTPASRSITVSGNTANINFTAAVNPAVTLTSPADNVTLGATATLRAETQGDIQSVAFARRTAASLLRSPNVPIPDATTVAGMITDSGSISTSGTIAEASVSLDIRHPYISDLIVVLIAPDGTRLTLHNRGGADADNIIQTYSNLALSGKQMAGTWQLEVTDVGQADAGTLVSWSLNLGAAWVAIGSGTQSPTNVWTASWSTPGTPPGVYQVRALATHAAGSLADINNNISIPATFSVQGRVVTSAGTGINGVLLSLGGTGITATTNSNGDFTLTGVPAGNYTLTPSVNGYSFSPTSRSVSVTSTNVTGQNFTGTQVVTNRTISGRIANSSGTGIANVNMALSGSAITALTNATGNFTLSNVPSGSYTLTPTLSGYSFSPTSRSVNVSGGDAGAQDFVATAVVAPTYTLSGRVSSSASAGLAGVTVSATVAGVTRTGTTSSTGNYSIAGVSGGTAVVVPSLTGYSFSPASRTVALSANVVALDFTVAVTPAVTMTSPLDNASIGAGTTLRADTQGAIQSVAFSRRNAVRGTRNVNLPIPDFTTVAGKVTDSQTINGTGTIAEATLTVSINHTYINDIIIVLIAPDGTRLTVRGQSGGAGVNINQTFNNLALVGKPMAGVWKLEVSDNGLSDTGTLVSWSLHFGTSWVAMASGAESSANVWTAPWSTLGTPAGIYEVRALATHAAGSVADINQNITVVRSFFNISGRIATSANVGIAGVSVTRTGSSTAAVTDAGGNYTFPDVPVGSYNITPALAQYSFSPTFRGVAVSNAPVSGINFTGTRAEYSIRGRITNHSGSGLPNIQVTRSGGPNVLTDANGDYVFTVISGDYTIAPLITPSLSGVTLYPAARPITVGTSNLSNQNFTASFTVTGKVSNSSGVGIPNIQVRRTAGASSVTVATDANGNYRFTDVRSGTYTVQAVVTPSMTGMNFYPGTTTITVDKANLTNINFIGWFSIYGRVTNSAGVGLANVQVMRRSSGGSVVSVFTDANGNYRFGEVRSGDYTISATTTGRTFSPVSRALTVGTLNHTNINFIGY